jgi:hypothetical protein
MPAMRSMWRSPRCCIDALTASNGVTAVDVSLRFTLGERLYGLNLLRPAFALCPREYRPLWNAHVPGDLAQADAAGVCGFDLLPNVCGNSAAYRSLWQWQLAVFALVYVQLNIYTTQRTKSKRTAHESMKSWQASKEQKFHHSVYVVLLDDAVSKHPSIMRVNPTRDPLKPCVYVGMTGLPVNHRFENHKNGYKSAWAVKKYGVRLMPELYVERRSLNDCGEPGITRGLTQPVFMKLARLQWPPLRTVEPGAVVAP